MFKEFLEFLRSKGFDSDASDVQSYADAAIGLIQLMQQVDASYDFEKWYKETQQNYPEDLANLTKLDDSQKIEDSEEENKLDYDTLQSSFEQYALDYLDEAINTIREKAPQNVYGLPSLDNLHVSPSTESQLWKLVQDAEDDLVTKLSAYYFYFLKNNLISEAKKTDEEEDEYTIYDLINDLLFGYGVKKSNFRLKWALANVGVELIDEKDNKRKKKVYFYPTANDNLNNDNSDTDRRAFDRDGIGVLLRDESEFSLAQKIAEEFKLDYEIKNFPYSKSGFTKIGVIKIPDEIAETPVDEYIESIGKTRADFAKKK